MTIQERIEKNPIVSLIVLAFIIVSGAAAIMQYFHQKEISIMEKQHSLDLKELRIKITSIKRSIGDSEYFDINNLFITKEQTMNVPANLKFFESDQFYAIEKTSNLIYKKYSFPELLAFEEEIEPSEIFKVVFADLYIHMWTTEEEIRIEGIEGLNLVSPKIKVQKISKDQLRGLLGRLFHRVNYGQILQKYVERHELNDGGFESLKVEESLENIYLGNWSAVILNDLFTQMLTIPALNSNAEYELLNIRNFGNLIYVQGLTTLSDVEVNGKRYEKYYIRHEFIFTSNFKQVYSISIIVPSTEPSTRNEYFLDVTEWLSNFKMILDK